MKNPKTYLERRYKLSAICCVGLGVTLNMVLVLPFSSAAGASTNSTYAQKLYKAGHLSAAKDAFIDLVCKEPKNYVYRYWLGIVTLGLGDYKEAMTHFETCLDLYPDPNTTRLCIEGLDLVDSKLGRLTRDQEHQTSCFQALLANQGETLRMQTERGVLSKRAKLVDDAYNKARDIRNQAQNRIADIRRNATWWTLDREKGEIVPVVSPDLESSIKDNAEALADSVVAKASEKADTLQIPDTDPVTQGLLSQLTPSARPNSTHLIPLGSNIYVRNYRH